MNFIKLTLRTPWLPEQYSQNIKPASWSFLIWAEILASVMSKDEAMLETSIPSLEFWIWCKIFLLVSEESAFTTSSTLRFDSLVSEMWFSSYYSNSKTFLISTSFKSESVISLLDRLGSLNSMNIYQPLQIFLMNF